MESAPGRQIDGVLQRLLVGLGTEHGYRPGNLLVGKPGRQAELVG